MKEKIQSRQYLIPPEELQTLGELTKMFWTEFLSQRGEFGLFSAARMESGVYSDGDLIIVLNGKTKVLLQMTSEDLEEGSEIFRIVATSSSQALREYLEKPWYHMRTVTKLPSDLNLMAFLHQRNRLSVLRWKEQFSREDFGDTLEVISESGLLIENNEARIVIYPDTVVPLDMCFTTNEEKIKEVLAGVNEIIPIFEERTNGASEQ